MMVIYQRRYHVKKNEPKTVPPGLGMETVIFGVLGFGVLAFWPLPGLCPFDSGAGHSFVRKDKMACPHPSCMSFLFRELFFR